ncbi:hypothetical protein FRC09_019864 [Ceratobasidium sp. 395]|nr:hypothetical protein FRC09_019864 [Ceratobasidium sp. 395]
MPVHALLHIADDIERMGPVWCYWNFAMERFCGALARARKSNRFPFSSLNRHVLHTAQISMLKLLYNLAEILDLRQRRTNIAIGTRYEDYDDLVFVRPRKARVLPVEVRDRVAKYLSAYVGVPSPLVRRALNEQQLVQWGKVQQTDRANGGNLLQQVSRSSPGPGGDLVRAHKLCANIQGISRDASYVKYNSFVLRSRFWDHPRMLTVREKTTSYGRAELFVVVHAGFLRDLAERGNSPVPFPFTKPVILAIMSPIPTFRSTYHDMLVEYKLTSQRRLAGYEVIDVRDIDCLVGRIPVKSRYRHGYIVDRTTVVGRMDILDEALEEEEDEGE